MAQLRILGLDLFEQPARGLLVFPGPTPTDGAYAAMIGGVAGRFMGEWSAVNAVSVAVGDGIAHLPIDKSDLSPVPKDVIQAEILLFSLEFVLINLVVDLLYALVNPEIRLR